MPFGQVWSSAKELFPEGAGPILALHQAAPLQFRREVLDEVFKGPRRRGVHYVDPVNAGCRPSFQAIRDLLWRPGDARARAEGACNVADSCRPTIPNTGNDSLQNASDALNRYLPDRLIPSHVTEIHANGTARMGDHPVETEIFVDFRLFAAGLRFRTANDKSETLKEQDVLGAASTSRDTSSDIVNIRFGDFRTRRNDELSFGV